MSIYPFQTVKHLTQCTSTNQYIREIITKDSVRYNILARSDFQTSGKGHNKNKWESEKNKNLLLSFNLYNIGLQAKKEFYISAVVALTIIDVLKKYIDDKPISIKWPNDIYVGDEKISGTLIEHSLAGQEVEWSIIGVGLNINQEHFSDELKNPTSLNILNNKEYKVEEVLEDFIKSFSVWYEILLEKDYQKIKESYLEILYRKDELALYLIDEEEVKAIIRGVDDFGFLQLEVNRELQSYDVKQLEYLY